MSESGPKSEETRQSHWFPFHKNVDHSGGPGGRDLNERKGESKWKREIEHLIEDSQKQPKGSVLRKTSENLLESPEQLVLKLDK